MLCQPCRLLLRTDCGVTIGHLSTAQCHFSSYIVFPLKCDNVAEEEHTCAAAAAATVAAATIAAARGGAATVAPVLPEVAASEPGAASSTAGLGATKAAGASSHALQPAWDLLVGLLPAFT